MAYFKNPKEIIMLDALKSIFMRSTDGLLCMCVYVWMEKKVVMGGCLENRFPNVLHFMDLLNLHQELI